MSKSSLSLTLILSLTILFTSAFAQSALANDRAVVRQILDKTGRKDAAPEDHAEFNSAGRAVKLTLNKKGIDGFAIEEFPAEIFQLTALKGLLLKNNSLKALPDDIDRLSDLIELDIGGNSDLGSLPSTIGNLQNLRFLDVRQCGLTGLPPEFGKLKKLEMLQLWDNGFIMLPDCVTELTGLKDLHLNRNKLITLPPAITKMPNLKYIDTQRNSLCDLPSDIDKWLKGLDMRYKDHQWCR